MLGFRKTGMEIFHWNDCAQGRSIGFDQPLPLAHGVKQRRGEREQQHANGTEPPPGGGERNE